MALFSIMLLLNAPPSCDRMGTRHPTTGKTNGTTSSRAWRQGALKTVRQHKVSSFASEKERCE